MSLPTASSSRIATTANCTYMPPMRLICHDWATNKPKDIRVYLCSSSLSSLLTTTTQCQAVVFWYCAAATIGNQMDLLHHHQHMHWSWFFPSCIKSSKLHKALIMTHQDTKVTHQFIEKRHDSWQCEWLDSALRHDPYQTAIDTMIKEQASAIHGLWQILVKLLQKMISKPYISNDYISFSQHILDPGLITMMDGCNWVQWCCCAYISRRQHEEWHLLLYQS